jgi:16S rRNA (cytidine1402-2'-O)-methyltransferase
MKPPCQTQDKDQLCQAQEKDQPCQTRELESLYKTASLGTWQQQIQSLTGLFLIPTPIGHLEDLSVRALVTLGAMDGLLCEDTRQTRLLLNYYGLSTPCYAYHAHNEYEKLAGVMARLRKGARLGLVSDRGTPLMSDPGFPLVRACLAEDVCVHGLPGASSILLALSLSGLPCTPFFFQGFLPVRRRKTALDELGKIQATLVIFESPHRLAATLAELCSTWGDRQACLLRELTKKFQQRIPGSLSQLESWAREAPHIGECVLVVSGA